MAQHSQEMKKYNISLKEVRKEATDAYSFVFSKPRELEWQGGANIHLADPVANTFFQKGEREKGKEHVRHLSLVTLPEEGAMIFTTRIPDPCSEFKQILQAAKIGDVFQVFKLENRIGLKREGKPIILISAGIAVATMRPMIREYSENQEQIPYLIHITIDSRGEFVFAKEIASYADSVDSLTNYCVDSREQFYQLIQETMDKDANYIVVGSDEFNLAVGKFLLSKGLPIESLIYDKKPEFYNQLIELPQ